MIIDEQDSQTAARTRHGRLVVDLRGSHWCDGSHRDDKSRALVAAIAARDQRSAVGLRERFGNGEAKSQSAGAFVKRLRPLFERIEDSSEQVGLDSDAVILHCNFEPARRRVRG